MTPSDRPAVEQSGAFDEERLARAVLSRVAEPGDAALAWRVLEHGAAPVLRWLRGETQLAAVVGADDRRAAPSARRLEGYRARLAGLDPRLELQRAERAGIRLVVPADAEWPGQLADLETSLRERLPGVQPLVPPMGLWVRGEEDLRLAVLRSVAVVGARSATAYGEHVASDLAAGLAARGWTVVSGAAYGVDAAAHRGALAAGGTTVAVLACGVDVPYPRGHDALVRRIGEQGIVVSELPPGSAVTRLRLLQRNRLVAALTRGTVVVEAALRSGTTTTARQARTLGRVVMAVPGPVTSSASVGCHRMLRDGEAVLVTGPEDVLEAVAPVGEALREPARGPERPEDLLDPVVVRVLDALPARRPVGTARLARTAGLDLATLRRGLGELLAAGLAESVDGGYRISSGLRRRGRSSPPATRQERIDGGAA